MTCKEFGMPFYKTSYQFGNLFVLFKVTFPDKIDEKLFDQIKKCLPKSHPVTQTKADQSVVLEEFHDEHKNSHSHPDDHDSNEEEEDGH
jgi:DnaJ-class molecular chaperone